MTADEKDLIDLEVTSFMTACAAGVDALKALLQRERLRRMEQEAAAARAVGEDGQGLDDIGGGGSLGGGGGGELLPGSRPAHEHAAVTFLFERLKAVTEVAETMQVRYLCYNDSGTDSGAVIYGMWLLSLLSYILYVAGI